MAILGWMTAAVMTSILCWVGIPMALYVGGFIWLAGPHPVIKAPEAMGLYAFEHPEGWVITWDLHPDQTYTQCCYTSLEELRAGRPPALQSTGHEWRWGRPPPNRFPLIYMSNAWGRLENPLIAPRPEPPTMTEAVVDTARNGTKVLVFDSEADIWAYHIASLPGGGYAGMETLDWSRDRMRGHETHLEDTSLFNLLPGSGKDFGDYPPLLPRKKS